MWELRTERISTVDTHHRNHQGDRLMDQDTVREIAEEAASNLGAAMSQLQAAVNMARRARNHVDSFGVTESDLYAAVSAAEEAAHEADSGVDELNHAAKELEDALEALEEAEDEGRGGGILGLMM